MALRRKLILLYSALLALMIIFFGVIVFGVIRTTWIEAVDGTLRETAQQVLTNSRAYPLSEFGSSVRTTINLPQLDIFRASGVFVQVWEYNSSDRSSHFASASDNLNDFRDPLDKDLLGSETQEFSTVTISNTELRVFTHPIKILGQTQLLGNLQVAASLQTVNDATNKLSLAMMIGGGMAVAGSLLLGMWLSNQTMKPIEAIVEAAEGISTAKDLGKRLPWSGPDDELGQIVDVFNRLMDRLEHLFGVQHRLVADVSHELRTPLTAIRGNLDLIKRYGVDSESLEAIASESDRMARLVNDLLLLARADYGSMQIELAQVDLDTVVSEVFKEAKILAKDRNLQIHLIAIEPVRMMGNSDRLKQLLLNLIGNAIKFTPDGGQISLGLRREGSMARLTVSDTGVGIPPEALARIFDRFYQADPARSRPSEGGAGLGLAIAKWIVESHNGTIEVQSEVGKGTTFIVLLKVLEQRLSSPPPIEVDASYGSYLSLPRFGRRKRTPETAPESTPES
ncbi:MAG: ATP-binding protein [Chloroflexota bacterium]